RLLDVGVDAGIEFGHAVRRETVGAASLRRRRLGSMPYGVRSHAVSRRDPVRSPGRPGILRGRRMPAVTRHIGLSLGADICWPLAFEQILADSKLNLKVGKDTVQFACERVAVEPFRLQR